MYSLMDSESVEGGKPGSTVSAGLIGSKLPDPYAIKGGVASESDTGEYSGGSRGVRTLCADCEATCYPVLEREHGNVSPGVDSSSILVVLVRSQKQLTESVSLDCSSVTSDEGGDKECPGHLRLTISETDLKFSPYKEAVLLLKDKKLIILNWSSIRSILVRMNSA